MTRFKGAAALLGVCGFCFFAWAASASAEAPEWGKCLDSKNLFGIHVKKGHFKDANCTKEDFKEKDGKKEYEGKYEFFPTGSIKEAGQEGFYVNKVESMEVKVPGHFVPIVCPSGELQGWLETPKGGEASIRLSGCHEQGTTKFCTEEKLTQGRLLYHGSLRLGFINSNAKPPEVGVLFVSGFPFFQKIGCEGQGPTLEVKKGGVIAMLTGNVNVMSETATYEWKFAANKNTAECTREPDECEVQVPLKFEGEMRETLLAEFSNEAGTEYNAVISMKSSPTNTEREYKKGKKTEMEKVSNEVNTVV